MQDSNLASSDQVYQQALDGIDKEINDMEFAEIKASQLGKGLGDYDLSAATAVVRQQRVQAEKTAEQERIYQQQTPDQQAPLLQQPGVMPQAGQQPGQPGAVPGQEQTISATPRGPLGFSTNEKGKGEVATGDETTQVGQEPIKPGEEKPPNGGGAGGEVIVDPVTGKYIRKPKIRSGQGSELVQRGLKRVYEPVEPKTTVIPAKTIDFENMDSENFDKNLAKLSSQYPEEGASETIHQKRTAEDENMHNQVIDLMRKYQDVLRPALESKDSKVKEWSDRIQGAKADERSGIYEKMPDISLDKEAVLKEFKKTYGSEEKAKQEYGKLQKAIRYFEYTQAKNVPGLTKVTGTKEKAGTGDVRIGLRSLNLSRGEEGDYEKSFQEIQRLSDVQGQGKKDYTRNILTRD